MREPYADRFRLILNDLGAGLAARGDELAEIIERSEPGAARDQRGARDPRRPEPPARRAGRATATRCSSRWPASATGSPASSTTPRSPAQATAERRADLEQGLAQLPPTLRELRLDDDRARSGSPTPARRSSPSSAPRRPPPTRATKALGPFADVGRRRRSISLGDAAEASRRRCVASDPVIRQIRKLAQLGGAPATRNLAKFLRSTCARPTASRTCCSFVYQATGAFNGFDDFGHFVRAFLLITNCNDYVTDHRCSTASRTSRSRPRPSDQDRARATPQARRGGASRARRRAATASSDGRARSRPSPSRPSRRASRRARDATPRPSGAAARDRAVDPDDPGRPRPRAPSPRSASRRPPAAGRRCATRAACSTS